MTQEFPFDSATMHILLGAAIFCVGLLGFLVRRSALVVLMCIELMLNGVNILLVVFSKMHNDPNPVSLILFVVMVAAAEAAIALALLVAIFKKLKTVSLENIRGLRG